MSSEKRPRISNDAAKVVNESFTRDGEGTPPKCNICSKVLKVDKVYNLKRHLETLHSGIFDGMVETCEVNENLPRKRKIPTVPVPIDKDLLVECGVKMVTSGGLAFNSLDQPGLRDLLGILTSALKIPAISRKTIPENVATAASLFKTALIQELKGKFICLKMDSATRKGKSVIAICAQYIIDCKLVMRTLAVYELAVSHTAETIRDEVIRVLKEFEVDISQVYAITTDNGANFLKAARLIYEAQRGLDQIDYDPDFDEVDDPASYEGNDEEERCIELLTNALSDSVRCAAHTLQLCVYDAIKKMNIKPNQDRIKSTVKQLRMKQYRRIIEQSGVSVPKLDNDTRWNSGYSMLEYFDKNEKFIRELIDGNDHVQLSEEDWLFIKEYVQVFEPVFYATLRLQNESLTMGNFFFIWLDCLLQLKEMTNSKMASALVEAMKTRQEIMFQGKAFLAALYLDPRINYLESDFVTDEQKNIGLQHLMKLWVKIKSGFKEPLEVGIPSSSTTPVSRIESMLRKKDSETAAGSSSAPVSRIEAMLRKKDSTMDQPKTTMETRLREMPLRPRLSSTACVIQYYWNLKRTDPMLYSLAQVALAVPCTQVSAERSFSALGLILTDKRMRLCDKNLSNVMFVKLNQELFDKYFAFG